MRGRPVDFISVGALLDGVVWEAIAEFPEWFLIGLGLAGASTLLIALAFIAGQRAFPRLEDDPGGSPEREGAERRLAEIRHYLEAIDERYVEKTTVEGHGVEFYLPERDVAVTFDARVFFRLEATDTDPVLVEHELPGGHLGSRLPFETPEIATDEDADAGVATAFAALGLPASADVDEVRRAYRRRVKEVHPDQGGDEDEFRRIREAYDTAREHAD